MAVRESQVKVAYVMSDKISGNCVKISLSDNHNEDNPHDNIRPARIVGQVPSLKRGDKCLVIKESEEQNATLYFLGLLEPNNKLKSSNASGSDEKDRQVVSKSKDGKTKILCDDNIISMKSGSNKLEVGNTIYGEVQGGSFSIGTDSAGMLSKRGDLVQGSIVMSAKETHIYNNKSIRIETQSLETRVNDGNYVVTGGRITDGTETAKEKYKALNHAHFKTKNFSIDTEGGTFQHIGNVFTVKLGSAAAAGAIPGTGPSTAFGVDILQGDAKITTGLGSIKLNAYNFKAMDDITLRVGTILHPAAGELKLSAYEVSLGLDTMYSIINSKLNMSPGGISKLVAFKSIDLTTRLGDIGITAGGLGNVNIKSMLDTKINALKAFKTSSILGNTEMSSMMAFKIDSLMDFSVASKLGNIKLAAMLTATIDAKIKATIKSAMVEISAAAMTTIKTAMLDLKGASIIDMGPKVAAPTGTGCFNSLNFCLFAGAPHSGPIAIG